MIRLRCPSVARARSTSVMPGVVATVLAVLISLGATISPVGDVASAATGRTFHVSCSGNDAATGRSKAKAWRTLAKASSVALRPGDRLLLQRGCVFKGPLRTGPSGSPWAGTSANPIVIGAYGSGSRPMVRDAATNFVVTGRYLVFQDLRTTTPPVSYDSQCENAPRGNTYGWRLHQGSHHVTIRRSRAKGLHFAVWINEGSHHNRIMRNTFVDINVKDPNPASDAGAVAVAVHGDDNEIGWNHISGSDSCSRLYGRDGAAVDIYGGQRNVLHHNIAVDNNAFLEIGRNQQTDRLGRDTLVAYNEVRSSLRIANFLVVRGSGSRYGPTLGTVVRHNSVYMTGAESYALQCTDGCTPSILDFRDNIVWARDRVGYVDGTWTEARNVWWSPTRPNLWFSIAGSSRHAPPRFRAAAKGDLRLKANSPAVNAGGAPPTMPGGAKDLGGLKVPRGARPDIGAWER